MQMLVVKARNAAELFWDSLDAQERIVVLYFLGYLALTVTLAVQRASRERLKAELREELVTARVDSRV